VLLSITLLNCEGYGNLYAVHARLRERRDRARNRLTQTITQGQYWAQGKHLRSMLAYSASAYDQQRSTFNSGMGAALLQDLAHRLEVVGHVGLSGPS